MICVVVLTKKHTNILHLKSGVLFLNQYLAGLGIKIFLNLHEASQNNSDVELAKVLAHVSSSTGQLQTAQRK
jgi:hypothetical protein